MPRNIVHSHPAPTFSAKNSRVQNGSAHEASALGSKDDAPVLNISHANSEHLNHQYQVVSQLPGKLWDTHFGNLLPLTESKDQEKKRYSEHKNIAQWAPLTSPLSVLKMPVEENKLEPETVKIWSNLKASQPANLQQILPSTTAETESEKPLNIDAEGVNIVNLANKTVAVTSLMPDYFRELETHTKIMLDNNIKTLVIVDSPSMTTMSASTLGTAFFKTQRRGDLSLVSLPYPYMVQLDDHAHLRRQRVIVKEARKDDLKSMELEVLYVHQYTSDVLMSPDATNQLVKYINGLIAKSRHSGAVWIYEQSGGKVSGTVIGALALQRYVYFGASLTQIAQTLAQPSASSQSDSLLSNKEQLDVLIKLAKRHRTPLYSSSFMPYPIGR